MTAAKPPLEIDQLVEIVSTAYTNVKGAIPAYVSIPPNPATPYTIGFQLGEQYWDVFVNPTTGKVLGDRQWETSLVGRLYDLHIHYQGMVGRIYLESKALELIALQLHQLLANERGTIDLPALKQYEIDSPLERLRQRIHQAKDILLQQQIDPPSLMELSQQVGLYQSISSKLKVAKTLARS